METELSVESTTVDDIEQVLPLYTQASEFLNSQNIDQWQNNYPNRETLLEDIESGGSYVVRNRDGHIVATFYLANYEETYDVIYDGNWNEQEPYCVIHRLTISPDYRHRGICKYVFQWVRRHCQQRNCGYIRVDTHEQNKIMQHCFEKQGFTYCGLILLKDNTKRLAYDLVL